MSRIIAGSRGGRRLSVPAGSRTRPTTDRVREALFSAVAAWAGTADAPADQSLAGLAVADLYAGSGAVGLEAASRGAEPVLLVESDRRTAQLIGRNAAELGLGVQQQSVRVEQLVAAGAPRPFDVVFLDPPYDLAAAAVEAVLADLVAHSWLAPDALVVVERSRRGDAVSWPAGAGETWTKSYGETVLHYAIFPGAIFPGAIFPGAIFPGATSRGATSPAATSPAVTTEVWTPLS
ncbi:16S rRNA (guanine(966)-N(2))-methyltransferase RsmD [uncultured Friedmanniella sp.]|uniref:16S rRNA (guanine(966)-N(2))-methyltransferase RsmD n=1 Tax=uncultured Friedmanniella sp. TaxID=335381 RepID=UPI0035CB2DBD